MSPEEGWEPGDRNDKGDRHNEKESTVREFSDRDYCDTCLGGESVIKECDERKIRCREVLNCINKQICDRVSSYSKQNKW